MRCFCEPAVSSENEAAEGGQASPGELTELVGTSKANMSRILDQMTNDGLISRSDEVKDGRRHVIQITPKGRRIATGAVPGIMTSLETAFFGLNQDELSTLNTLMQKAILSLDTSGIRLQAEDTPSFEPAALY